MHLGDVERSGRDSCALLGAAAILVLAMATGLAIPAEAAPKRVKVETSEVGYRVTRVKAGVSISTGTPTTDTRPFDYRFVARDIVVENVFPRARAEIDALVALERGHLFTIADAFEFAKRVEAIHKAQGYPLARVLVPDQTIGPVARLRLQIVDVRVGAVHSPTLPAALSERVNLRATTLINKPMPTATELATLVGLSEFEFGRDLTMETKETDDDEKVALVLTGPSHQVLSEIGGNAFLSKPFKVLTANAGTGVVNAFGTGERLAVGGTWARENDDPAIHGPLWAVAASGLLPLPAQNDSFLDVSGSAAAIHLRVEPTDAAKYDVVRGTAFYTMPRFIGTDQSYVWKVGVQVSEEHEGYATGPISLTVPYETFTGRTEIAWVNQLDNGIKLEAGGDGFVGATRSLRLDDVTAQAKQTRPVARIMVHGQADIPGPEGLVFRPSARGAVSLLDPLPPLEQLQLFQSNAPIPVDPRSIEGDSGGYVRLEVARAFPTRVADRSISLEPYAFGAAGIIYQRESYFLTAARLTGDMYGAGLRVSVAPASRDVPVIDSSIEFYRQTTTDILTPNYSALTLATRVRF